MKLLFDHNLSFKLCRRLSDLFPGSMQLRTLGMGQGDDLTVWRYASRHGYTIVTQDADFAEMAALYGPPPQVVWLRCGNQPTWRIERFIRLASGKIEALDADLDAACLEIHAA